jgi:transcriptional antiterminator NusG
MENQSEKLWYSIQCRGGELKAIENIKTIIEMNKMQDYVEEILVPTEDLLEVKKGEKIIKERSIYSGYVFIKANLTTELQSLIQSISKVSGFVGDGKKAVSLSVADIDKVLNRMENRGEVKPKYNFIEGDTVLITKGSFANFKGVVERYDIENGMLELEVSIFGRKTPVEISFTQVEMVEDE